MSEPSRQWASEEGHPQSDGPDAAPSQEVLVQPTPYIRIPDFLTSDENRWLLDYVARRESDFAAASVTTEIPEERLARVLYHIEEANAWFEKKLKSVIDDAFLYIMQREPDIERFETQLTASGDGDYFKIHTDGGAEVVGKRTLTYTCYFSTQPRAFSGGSLKIFDYIIVENEIRPVESFVEIEPANNSIVFFPSWAFHEVSPVHCESERFIDSRFTLNGWAHTR